MRVEIWSDVVCPWCYLGKRRFERALSGFEGRDQVEVIWRSYQLDPSAPARIDDLAGHLADKYDIDREQALDMNEELTELAAGEGLVYRLDQAVGGNTLDAHQVVHLAARHGLAGAAEERLFAAYFSDGLAIGDRATLVRLATEIGLDPDLARSSLESGEFADEVHADQVEASRLGIRGVPFYLLDRRVGISGAQPLAVFERALREAWDSSQLVGELSATTADEGADTSCGDDACAIFDPASPSHAPH